MGFLWWWRSLELFFSYCAFFFVVFFPPFFRFRVSQVFFLVETCANFLILFPFYQNLMFWVFFLWLDHSVPLPHTHTHELTSDGTLAQNSITIDSPRNHMNHCTIGDSGTNQHYSKLRMCSKKKKKISKKGDISRCSKFHGKLHW